MGIMLFVTAIGGRNNGKGKAQRKRAPKSVLKLLDLEQSNSFVLNSLTFPSSQRTYDQAIREFIEWCCSEPRLAFDKAVVTGTEFPWNSGTAHQPPSISAWQHFGDSYLHVWACRGMGLSVRIA